MKKNFYFNEKLKCILLIVFVCIGKFTFGQFSTTSDIYQLSNGYVRIGYPLYAPSAGFQVRNTAVLFDGTTGATPPVTTGTFLFWSPAKGAFRAGTISNGSNWSDANTGVNSFACGLNTKASGFQSFASGSGSIASGSQSFASGSGSIASGSQSFATGLDCLASGNQSFAAGTGSTKATNFATTAMGLAAEASGWASVAMGSSKATGQLSTSFGNATEAIGEYSTSFGFGSKAGSFGSFALGQYNVSSGNAGLWVSTDPLFSIGNGTSGSARSNALVVLKDGKTGIGNISPIQLLDVNGRMNIRNGVIQKGGTAITTTSDLGLYSRDISSWIRIVTTGQPINFYSDGATSAGIGTTPLMSILSNGNVGIGTTLANNPNNYKLAVNGTIGSKAIKVEISSTTWADYVFAKDYKLQSLKEVEEFILVNKHLPNVPSAAEVEKEGLDLGAMNAKLLEKIEELTLHLIEQDKRIQQLENK